jgi:hypothetical protein
MEEVKKQGMESLFIPYEIALDLKELGFDEPCLLRIQYSSGTDVFTGRKFKNSIWLGNGYEADIDDKKIKYEFPKHTEQGYGHLKIPLYQQAFRWFREKHNLHAEPYTADMGAIEYCFQIRDLYSEKYIYDNFVGASSSYVGTFNTPEEAEQACLIRLIEIVKNK